MRQWIVLIGFAALFAWAVTKPLAPAHPDVFAFSTGATAPQAYADRQLPRETRNLSFWQYAPPPREHIRYLAPRPGRLPGDGAARVAGLQLPAGRRITEDAGHPGRARAVGWVTDAPDRGAVDLARRLADRFPRTGLWPVLWSSKEAVGLYLNGPDHNPPVSEQRPEALFRRLWRDVAPAVPGAPLTEQPFPGLAPGSRQSGTTVNPFALFAQYKTQIDRHARGPYRLILVACRRPADAIALTGLGIPDGIETGDLSAVLRTWEDRFDAYVTYFGEGYAILGVGSPPTTVGAAQRLADEYFAAQGPDLMTTDDVAGAPRALMGRGNTNDPYWGSASDFSAGTWGIP